MLFCSDFDWVFVMIGLIGFFDLARLFLFGTDWILLQHVLCSYCYEEIITKYMLINSVVLCFVIDNRKEICVFQSDS